MYKQYKYEKLREKKTTGIGNVRWFYIVNSEIKSAKPVTQSTLELNKSYSLVLMNKISRQTEK